MQRSAPLSFSLGCPWCQIPASNFALFLEHQKKSPDAHPMEVPLVQNCVFALHSKWKCRKIERKNHSFLLETVAPIDCKSAMDSKLIGFIPSLQQLSQLVAHVVLKPQVAVRLLLACAFSKILLIITTLFPNKYVMLPSVIHEP